MLLLGPMTQESPSMSMIVFDSSARIIVINWLVRCC